MNSHDVLAARMCRLAFSVAIACAAANPALSTPATPVTVWRTYQQQPGNSGGDARASRVLADGSLLVAAVKGGGLTMTRFDGSGNVLTYFPVVGAALGDSYAVGRSVAASAIGEVYVASGRSSNSSSSPSGSSITKWDAYTGLRLWPGAVPVDEVGSTQALALDPLGDVVLAGCAHWGSGFVVTKLSRLSGERLLPALLLPSDYLSFREIRIDAAGDLLALGTQGGGFSQPSYASVGKFSLVTGLEVWGPLSFSIVDAFRAEPCGDVVVWADGGVRRYSGSTGAMLWGPVALSRSSTAARMELDAAGDVFFAIDDVSSTRVARLDGSSGSAVWTRTLAGYHDGIAEVVDGRGDVIVYGPGGLSKLARASGATSWGPADAMNPSQGLLIDPSGDLLAVGIDPYAYAVRAARYAAGSGATVWGPLYAAPGAWSAAEWTAGVADASGDIVLATTSGLGKLGGENGATLWGPVSLTDSLSTQALLTDAAGDVVVAGGLSGGSTRIWKYKGSDGAPLWGPLSPPGWFVAAALDPSGDVFVLCSESVSSTYRLTVSKVSGASGSTLWSVPWPGGTAFSAMGTALRVVASSGNVVVAGVRDGNRGVLLSLSGASGSVLWGPVSLDDFAPSVTNVLLESASGTLLVTTITTSGWSGYPVQLRKVDAATGTVLWGPVVPLLPSPTYSRWLQAVDPSGDLLVTFGGSDYGTTPSRTVAKLRGADGSLAWRTLIVSSTRAGDRLIVDGGGDIGILGASKIDRVSGVDGSLLWAQLTTTSPVSLSRPSALLSRGRDLVTAGIDAGFSAATRITGDLVVVAPPEGSLTAACGLPFAHQLTAANGTAPYSWGLVGGALPQGLTLSSAGEIAGAAAGDGTYAFRVRVTDALGAFAERDLVLSVIDGQPLVAIAVLPSDPCAGDTVTLSVPGTWSAYEWSPGGAGSSSIDLVVDQPVTVAVRVTDAGGCRRHGILSLAPRAITPVPAISASAYVPANTPGLTASAAVHPGSTYAWSVAGGSITAGQGTSAITWTSGPPGAVTITVRETSGGACASPAATALVTAERQVASRFQPIPPCRVLDTRAAAGPRGGPSLGAGAARLVTVTGTCGIPADALALTANLTAVVPAAAGDLLVGPGDQPLAPVPLLAGRIRAVSMLLGLAGDGSGTVRLSNASAGSVDVLLDVSGYFR